jgi:transposase
MRTKGTAAELENRRRIGGRLLLQGKKLDEVAEACGVHVSSVKRWKKIVREKGLEGLAVKDSPGREPKLDEAQREKLVKILVAGPLKAGYKNDLWTCARVGEVIEKQFRVHYHPSHVWKILRSLGFSAQKPEQRAREQDEDEVRHWRRYKWPALKRGRAKVS